MNTELKLAVQELGKALNSDEDYRRAWKDNIAMAFKDEFWRTCTTQQDLDLMDSEVLHEIANKAAENFLYLLSKDNQK
jgi:hypothetical protein